MTMKAQLLEVLRRRWLTPLTALEDMWVKLPNGKSVKAYHVLQ